MAEEYGLSLVAAIRRAQKQNKCIRRKAWDRMMGIGIVNGRLCDAYYGILCKDDYILLEVVDFLANDWEVVNLKTLKGG